MKPNREKFARLALPVEPRPIVPFKPLGQAPVPGVAGCSRTQAEVSRIVGLTPGHVDELERSALRKLSRDAVLRQFARDRGILFDFK